MKTRQKTTSGPISQERYMSSNEFAELHGISGVAVSARAAVLMSDRKYNLIWFIQGLSLAEGGLRRVVGELLEIFSDRIGTPKMFAAKVTAEKICAGELLYSVKCDLDLIRWHMMDDICNNDPQKGSELIALCRRAALRRHPQSNGDKIPSLEEFLIDLCINPRIYFSEPGENENSYGIESEVAITLNPELCERDFKPAGLIYFRDIIGALFEYQAICESRAKEKFQLTSIGNKIWETLDYALASSSMVVLDGLEGRGKTESVKAWCNCHLGTARFVSLKGITNKTTAFREIAKALGIASSYTRTAPEMQARIEDVLKRSGIMLAIDEAHFVFNQSRRMYTRPELVDWIDTALCNRSVPVALVTTPQFIVCMTRAADQVEWNYRQFRRRVRRWVKLPATNTEADIRAVARHVFKSANTQTISKIVGYAMLSKRDVSAIGDVASEVRAMLGADDLSNATEGQVQRAIYEFLLPSDKTFLEGMETARSMGRRTRLKPAGALPSMTAPEDTQHEILPVHPRGNAPAREIRPASLVET